MKTAILSKSYPAYMMKIITALTILLFWILNQNGYAAGAPHRRLAEFWAPQSFQTAYSTPPPCSGLPGPAAPGDPAVIIIVPAA